MNTLDQIQTIIKQAAENSSAIQKRLKEMQGQIESVQNEIDNVKSIYSKNTNKFIDERLEKLKRKKEEYMKQMEKYKDEAMKTAEAWLNEQRDLLMKKLQALIQNIIKAKAI